LSKADRNFALKAAQAGTAEVAAAQLAVEKSSRNDVKDFARRMIADHTKAGNALKQVAGGKSLSLPESPSAADARTISKLSSETGATFDQDYIKAQRAAHKDAVALFTTESKSGKDSDLKSFAGETLPTLQDHYRMITAMPLKAQQSSR
jgi:putative membrane protein